MARTSVGSRGSAKVLYGYGATPDEAWSALAAKIDQHNRRYRLGDAAAWTVEQLADWWITEELPERVADRSMAPRTKVGYEQHVRLRMVPLIGHVPLDELSPAHVRRWLADLRKQGVSQRMRQYAHAVLRAMLQTAVRYELTDRNPAALVEPPNVAYDRKDEVTPDEARRLLVAAQESRLSALWTLMLHIPLRPGEPTGAQWSAFNLDKGFYVVERNLVRTGGEWVLSDLKTHRRRTVPLGPLVVQALLEHRQRQPLEASYAGWETPKIRDLTSGKVRPVDLVFRHHTGSPLYPKPLNADLARVCERAGVRRLTAHQLRHAATTLLQSAGVDPAAVQQLGGWSRQSMVDHYTGSMQDSMRRAVEEFEVWLRG